MNPRNIGNFLRSRFGLFIVFIIVLFSGLWIYGAHQEQEREAQKLAAQSKRKVELGRVRLPLNQGLEDGVPQQVSSSSDPGTDKEFAGNGIVPFHPPVPVVTPARAASATARPEPGPSKEPKPRTVRYSSLLAGYDAPGANAEPAQPPPERFIPFGTLLKCKLVNTLDSANMETPIIALLLEDVWQNSRLVIPANTLVHGTARAGRLRDRITATGTWRFVWQDGRELAFGGVALDREYEHDTDGYGITDGSAGIKGRLLAADDLQELKMLASAALSGFARGTQDRTLGAYGSTVTGSVSNGVREGAGEVFELYAQRTLKDIEENGIFVRVAAGKEFYLYVLQAVDPQKASSAGVRLRPSAAAAPAAPPPPIPKKG